MRRYYFLISSFVFGFFSAWGQSSPSPSNDFIEWNEFYRLSWCDFEGKPGPTARGDAGTSVSIRARPFRVGKNLYYSVTVLFNKKRSWVKDSSDALLSHEQLHFDIAELYARKVRKRIRGFGELKVEDLKTYNAAIQKILDKSNEEDVRYDAETLHGSLLKRQREWKEEVERELNALQEYTEKQWLIE